jgi:iron complex outermembrane recepter protein
MREAFAYEPGLRGRWPKGDSMKRIVVAALCSIAASVAFSQEDAVVVTAQRFPERRLDAPVGMTVITAEDIARDTARTVPEVLSHLGGLQVRNSQGSPDLQIDLRGMGITGDQNTLIMLDGVRLNEAELTPAKLSSIPLQSVERIEILRGSGTVLYGDNAVGGTINIITRGPKPGRRSDVLVGAGSYGTYDARASTNVATERSGITASAEHLESDNYRANNRLRQDTMAGDLRLGGEGTTVGLKFGADTQRLQLPGARTEAQLESDRRGATTPNDWSAREGAFTILSLGRSLGNAEVVADIGYRERESTSFSAPTPTFPFVTYQDTNTRNLTFSPRVRAPFRAGGVDNAIVAGFDWSDGDFDRRFAGSVEGLGAPTFGTSGSQQSAGTYVQYSGRFAAGTKLTAGAREQRVTDRQTPLGFPAPEQRVVHTLDAGEIGAEQPLFESLRLFGKYGKSFRIANIDENGFTSTGEPLKPQTAHNKEAGVEYRQGEARLRASAYRIDLENEIHFVPFGVPNPFGGTGANINLPPTRRQGVELFAAARVAPALDVSGNLVTQSARFRSGEFGGVDVTGHDVPLVPRQLATLSAAWRATQNTLLTAATRYVGRQRYDNDQANLFREMPAYSVTDLKVAYRHGRATWGLALNNAFNKRYYSYAIVDSPTAPTTFNAYPEIGRNVMGTVELAL